MLEKAEQKCDTVSPGKGATTEEMLTLRTRPSTSQIVQNAQFRAAYERAQHARELARRDSSFVRRFDAVTTLKATASSQNIDGGHSTALSVARAVRQGGETLKP